MKIFAIGGEPATGKSTLVKSILHELEPSHAFAYGRLKGHVVKPLNLWVFGIYSPEETFPGTDRLSMSVQPDAVKFLKELSDQGAFGAHGMLARYLIPPAAGKPKILFEGDRLVNGKFLRECAAVGLLEFIVLSTSRGMKDRRHETRKDTQSLEFLTGRATKTKNLRDAFEPKVWHSETLEDLALNRDLLIAKLKLIGS